MKRLLLALVPWMAMATAAFGQTRPATASLTHLGILKGAAYRIADECFVPASTLRDAGWHVDVYADRASIDAEGKSVDVPMRKVDGKPCVALGKAMDKLGGDSIWESDDQFDAVSVIKAIHIHEGKVEVQSTLDVKPTAAYFDSPGRIVIDFVGARLSRVGDFVADENARIGQFKPDTVRVVIETDHRPIFPSGIGKLTRNFTFDGQINEQDARPVAPGEEQGDPGQDGAKPILPPPTSSSQEDDGSSGGLLPPATTVPSTAPMVANTGPLKVSVESKSALVMSMALNGPLAALPHVARPDPDSFEIYLPGADVNLADDFKLDADVVEGVTTRQDGNVSVITVHTKRPVGVEVAASSAEVVVRLTKPNVGNGRLAGKTIVIDPGHGGHDSGAKALDGSVMEKNLTLAFAKTVSEKLTEEGAIVLLTRKTDVFIPLEDRSEVANRNGADFFISIHVNSNGLDSKSTGGITFYHLTDQTGQLLAQTIQHEIGKVVSIPSIGAWSDGRIYHSGFAVLRHSHVPAVLIETGFINNAQDRAKLQTEEFRESLAVGIVRGLKVFLGDVKQTD